jgi:hypothetical protein
MPSVRHAHLVTPEVTRKNQHPERTGPTPPAWPFSRYVEGGPRTTSTTEIDTLIPLTVNDIVNC